MVPTPLRRRTFRRLWAGMTTSYAGDRLQQLAQGWLVATLTNSALSVGLTTALGTLPLLLLPVGGVLAEQVDRKRLLVASQLTGAIGATVMTALVATRLIAVWHVYIWAMLSGLIWLVARPAYKVVLTECVPPEEVRPAVALNSTSETSSLVLVNGAGSVLLGLLGLPIAFGLNAASYVVAVAGLWSLPGAERGRDEARGLAFDRLLVDMADGWQYLLGQPALVRPLLLTLLTTVAVAPVFSLLPAIVHARGGSIVELGLLAAATSAGSLGGAIYAGAHDESQHPIRRYTLYGFVAAIALVLFALVPAGLLSFPPLVAIGFVLFAEAVWNTSRVRRLAGPEYQARIQAFTTMAFTLGMALATLWAGVAMDRLGPAALLLGASALAAALCVFHLTASRTPWKEAAGG